MKQCVVMLALLFAGCSRQKPGDIPAIRYGVNSCARCGMAVSEERFACGYVDAEGRSVVFDDVGEFLEAVRQNPDLASVSFVHDAQDGLWLRASEAFFVRIAGLATPMGTGFAAFASKERARSFGKRFGAEGLPLSLSDAAAK